METKIFTTEQLAEASGIIRDGGLVAMPTETVYGLAANALDEVAVKSIYTAKGRASDNPLIVHISDLSQWAQLVTAIPESALKLARAFWPGPLTIILPKSDIVPSVTSGGLDTVAVRLPSHPVAREFISACGCPIAAPSANLSGSPSPTTVESVVADMTGRIAGIIDGGNCEVGVESTVITLATHKPTLLRPGAITPEQLESVLGEIVIDKGVTHEIDISKKVASPGMKYKHYSPKAKVYIVDTASREEFTAFVNTVATKGTVALCYDSWHTDINTQCVSLGEQGDSLSQSEVLFESLRQCDKLGASVVYTPMPSAEGVGLAVLNRLLRAAAFSVIDISGKDFKLVGVTGQTGAGKSTVARDFTGPAGVVIDCDSVAHQVLEQPEVKEQVEKTFGTSDRRKLASVVFLDSEKLKALTDITFPLIIRTVLDKVHEAKSAGCNTVVLDAPTLIESGLVNQCDQVVFVRAPQDVRLARITSRDGLTEEQALERMSAQPEDDFYLKYATEVVDNY